MDRRDCNDGGSDADIYRIETVLHVIDVTAMVMDFDIRLKL